MMRNILYICTFISSAAFADLMTLSDTEMSETAGAGIGFALENFVFDTEDAELSLTGINDTSGNPVTVNWTGLYVMGEGSENGTIKTPTNIGGLFHPWVLRTARGSADWTADGSGYHSGDYAAIGNDIALVEFTTDRYYSPAQDTIQYAEACVMNSSSLCADYDAVRRAGMDVGSVFEFVLGNGRTDYFDINFKGLYIDNSSIRLWSRPDSNGLAQVNANVRITAYAEELDIGVCGGGCDPSLSTLNFDDVYLNLNLGYGEIQPLLLEVTADGNFTIELTKPNAAIVGVDTTDSAAMQQFYDDYYANAPKSNVYIGNIQVGQNTVGETIVNGFRAQYLKITSMDL